MHFSQLAIQTQRDTPANARSAGFAWLVRAGYITREGQPLALAQRVQENLQTYFATLANRFEASFALNQAFFHELGLPVLATTDEFFFESNTGDNEILRCTACGYTVRRELAQINKKPFSVEAPLPIEQVATPNCSTIESLAAFLGIAKEKTAKALMYTRLSDGKFVFIIVRGDMQLSEAKLRQRIGEVRPATATEIAAAGAVAGYASPVGIGDALIVVDDLIPRSPNLAAGANISGFHLKNVNYPRDFQAHLVMDVVLPRNGDPCPQCDAPLELRAVETLATGAAIRFDSLLLPLAETHHDEKGLTLPKAIAPFDVYLMNLPSKQMDTALEAKKIYMQLQAVGVTTLYDNREERAGIKFNDADLIGCPIRITLGERNFQNGLVEIKRRRAAESQLVALDALITSVKNR